MGEFYNSWRSHEISNPNSLTRGFYDEDRLVALSMGQVTHWYSATQYYVNELCVKTECQGKGIPSVGRKCSICETVMNKKMTVNEVSKLTGVSIRALQYYDNIGLLKPSEYTQSGYRLYDDTVLERLQQILLFKELEFSLKEIKEIMSAPDFDRQRALEQQIELLTLKKEHIEKLIDFARGIKTMGVEKMDFSVFDTGKIKEYTKRAREQWGETPEYREFEEKSKNQTDVQQKDVMTNFMLIFAEFGKIKDQDPASETACLQVKKLKDYISEHFYHCSNEILSGLGKMYADGGEFTENIDSFGGQGTAVFTSKAIENYCKRADEE